MQADAMSDLSDVAAALQATELDVSALEDAARTHEDADAVRFKQLQEDQGKVHTKLDNLETLLTLMHDQVIEGFRKHGVILEHREPKRGRNGI